MANIRNTAPPRSKLTGFPPLENNMRNILVAGRYEHRYVEFYGSHSEINWQDQIEPALRYLLGDFKP